MMDRKMFREAITNLILPSDLTSAWFSLLVGNFHLQECSPLLLGDQIIEVAVKNAVSSDQKLRSACNNVGLKISHVVDNTSMQLSLIAVLRDC